MNELHHTFWEASKKMIYFEKGVIWLENFAFPIWQSIAWTEEPKQHLKQKDRRPTHFGSLWQVNPLICLFCLIIFIFIRWSCDTCRLWFFFSMHGTWQGIHGLPSFTDGNEEQKPTVLVERMQVWEYFGMFPPTFPIESEGLFWSLYL